eukprot:SAG31_NODE_1307_length_8887_cov_3.767183_2_plen_377_part_00
MPAVGGGQTTAQLLQQYPLDFVPCWVMGEVSGQRDGDFPAESRAQLTVQDWVAYVGGGVKGQLWFTLSYSVNPQIVETASTVGTKLALLADSILSPVGVDQPSAKSSTDGVLARAFENSRGELFVAVVNERLAPVANVSLSVVQTDGTSLLEAGCQITVPFEESRLLATRGMITEPLGSYGARVYHVTKSCSSSPTAYWSAAKNSVRQNLVKNSDFSAQTLVAVPDHWLLFPTVGTPAGSMDLEAMLMSDPAAARRESNTTAALRIVISNPLGTGIHLPLVIDHTGLSQELNYSLSFWARINAVTGAGVLTLARSPRSWHYGDASPSLLESMHTFTLSAAWQKYSVVLSHVNGTLNLLPREPGALWLSEVSLEETA